MKKIKWMDVVIASPMVLTFASAVGGETVLISVGALTVIACLLKWGKMMRSLERKPLRRPVVASQAIL